MAEFKEINYIIYATDIVLWYMYLTHVLFYYGNQTNHIIPTEHSMYGLMNITPMYPLSKITRQGLCNFNGIKKCLFRGTPSRITLFRVNLTSLMHFLWNPS